MHYIARVRFTLIYKLARKWFCSATVAMEKRLVNYYPFVWHTHVHTHAHMYTYTYKNTRTHTQTHTQAPKDLIVKRHSVYC